MWCWSPTTGTTWGEGMIRHRHIDGICIAAMALALVLTGLFCFGEVLGLQRASASPGYVSRLFHTGRVHTVDLQVENWEAFLENAPAEEYIPCTAVIDGEVFRQVGLRAKGNNSLRLTHEYGLSRYSLKLEFDQYVDGNSYYGLDKFSLDGSFQDNSYLKSWMAYDMMDFMGVPAPLRSYVWVTVNGVPWGLFWPSRSRRKRLPGAISEQATASSINRTTVLCRMRTPMWRCGMWGMTPGNTTISSATPNFPPQKPTRNGSSKRCGCSPQGKTWNRQWMWTRCCAILPSRCL